MLRHEVASRFAGVMDKTQAFLFCDVFEPSFSGRAIVRVRRGRFGRLSATEAEQGHGQAGKPGLHLRSSLRRPKRKCATKGWRPPARDRSPVAARRPSHADLFRKQKNPSRARSGTGSAGLAAKLARRRVGGGRGPFLRTELLVADPWWAGRRRSSAAATTKARTRGNI